LYLCNQNQTLDNEKVLFDAACDDAIGQLRTKTGTEREGSDEGDDTGSVARYGG
jgi:hypothetical protein